MLYALRRGWETSAASDSRGVHVPEGAGRPAAPGEGLPRASSAASVEEPIPYEFYAAVCDERDRLREALTFYARPLSWVTDTEADQGEIAREALNGFDLS